MNSDLDDRAFAEEFGQLLRRGLIEVADPEEGDEGALRVWPTAAGVAEVAEDGDQVGSKLDPRD